MSYKRLWIAFGLVIGGSFAVLGFYGHEIYRMKPPIPARVVTSAGTVLFTGQDIRDGQNVWQSMGGQQVGSIWGHGAYVAPDWTADWLHREATWLLNHWAGRPYEQLEVEARATLKARLKQELRTNTYQPATGDLVISPVRAEALAAVSAHYSALFGDDPALAKLRDAYAIPSNAIKDPDRQRKMNAFFW
ncbi:MAG: hypothetical protein PCFJNLEI_00347 [Verrucomicrobiae bacterium]|nr:hypothetical protein [Verrucomicrobiae bacterium]